MRSLGAVWREQWPYLLGALGVGGVALLAIHAAPDVGSAGPPAAPPGARPLVWLLLEGDHVELREGVRYRGCVRLSWAVRAVPGASYIAGKIGPGLAEKGFRDIVVARVRPSDWPEETCSIFVEATWGKPPEQLARPSRVELAWESRPA